MQTYQFTCPDCCQDFTVTDPMREATLSSGCPVCGGPVASTHFVVDSSSA
ncbi:DUF7560 family zinc ribbon protein [Natronorubrum sulfidifaciens]|uniref:Uncharacterized protein n=1 Tax=Natronorubrum sulfidifaciens JCM 14089 TaxID=1230460 RepID=L9WA47_9EURY|nr:zinc ribbon domain-containing protein [Natronorubrum sulfidifaciens]ELY45188.1 hypothetical protein C495_09605 [Natronorubrum sulfidifaciens JCM 14089]